MAKLYLLGGENIVRQSANQINRAAFVDAGGSPKVVVFPWARASFDNVYSRRRRVRNYFQSLGAQSVEFVDYSDTLEEIAAKMIDSELVYLTGGQMTILVTRLNEKGVDKLLRTYQGIIVGRSAGALALAKQGVVTNRYSHQVKLVPGVGLANLCLKTHYEPAKDASLKRLSKTVPIYALPTCSAIICIDSELSVLGDAYLFENGEKQHISHN